MTTLRIKLSRCHLCNATKTRPSPTAYVFCDFCGALIDFDFQTAIGDSRSKLPGPEYERLRAALAPQLEKAQQRGDKDAYLELQRKLFAAYVEACPAACSPRINDPAYREKYIEHSARATTEGAFDPQMKAASDRQAAVMKALQWIPGGSMGVTCRPDTFWALYDTVLETAEVAKRMEERTGLAALQPDGDTPVNARIGLSMFVQGWLPYLKTPEIDELMRRTGLASDYVEPTAAKDEVVPCGVCKAEVHRFEGAKQCVCDGCGHLLFANLVTSCSHCAAKLLLPAERTSFQCAFCSTELRTQAWTMGHFEKRV